jgi:hypothetical protein
MASMGFEPALPAVHGGTRASTSVGTSHASFAHESDKRATRIDDLQSGHWEPSRVARSERQKLLSRDDDDCDLERAVRASLVQQSIETCRAVSKGEPHDADDGFQRAVEASLMEHALEASKAQAHAERLELIREAEELHLRDSVEQDLPPQLAGLMGSLRDRHPSLVKEIQSMAGVSLKFEFLRLSLRNDVDDFANKQALQDIFSKLSIEERLDLQHAYLLADGERNAYFLQIVEEDRRQRHKLGGATHNGKQRIVHRGKAPVSNIKGGRLRDSLLRRLP